MEGDLVEQMRCYYRKKARNELREREQETQVDDDEELPRIRRTRMLSPERRRSQRKVVGVRNVGDDYDANRREVELDNQDGIDVRGYRKDDECVICMDEVSSPGD
jgi:hypothetical protein